MADAGDLKSPVVTRAGSSPAPGTVEPLFGWVVRRRHEGVAGASTPLAPPVNAVGKSDLI